MEKVVNKVIDNKKLATRELAATLITFDMFKNIEADKIKIMFDGCDEARNEIVAKIKSYLNYNDFTKFRYLGNVLYAFFDISPVSELYKDIEKLAADAREAKYVNNKTIDKEELKERGNKIKNRLLEQIEKTCSDFKEEYNEKSYKKDKNLRFAPNLK